jgi:hypothetical protein
LQFFFASPASPIASTVLADVRTSNVAQATEGKQPRCALHAPNEADFFGTARAAPLLRSSALIYALELLIYAASMEFHECEM